MSRPIKETPILYGKDAEVFEAKMEQAGKIPMTREEYDRIMVVYKGLCKKQVCKCRKPDGTCAINFDAPIACEDSLICIFFDNDF